MASETVASWTPVIVKGGVFQKTITVTDEAGAPITLNSAEIVVTPNGASPFSWTQGNGKFTNASPGVYDLALTAVDTAAYSWTSGKYRLSVTDNVGDPNPCLIEGLIFAKDC
jgi:hypothetical protein